MIERELANVFDLTLLRPVRTGPGLDTVGTPVTIAENLCAIYEPVQILFRDLDNREITLTSKFWIDPCDSSGNALDIRANDWLQFTDFRGVLQKEQQIRRVSPWFIGRELDHITLEIG